MFLKHPLKFYFTKGTGQMTILLKLPLVFMQRFNQFNIINKNTMSLQPKNKNVRVLSAKIVQNKSERARPLSGVPNQTYTRRQMIVNSYNSQGGDNNRVQSARITPNIINSQNFQSERYVKKVSNKKTKQKQQMQSQIMGLKQTINRLVQEISLQRGKVETLRKKNLKFSKLLGFWDDDRQPNSNTVNNHLIQGIKNMYDTLKQKYQAKCKELELFIKKPAITKELQNQQYIYALQGEVRNLKKKIEKINEVNISSAFSSQTQKQANEYVLSDLQNENSNITQKYQQLKKKHKQLVQVSKDQQLQIRIDTKLIREKDNCLHALERKNKELNKQILKFKQLNLSLQQQLEQLNSNYQREVQLHQQTIAKYEQKCKADVESVTQAKNSKIRSLQDDNDYLHKMIQDLRSTNLQLNKNYQELKDQTLKNSNRNNGEYYSSIEIKRNKSLVANKAQSKRTIQAYPPIINGKRVAQKADKKYHQDSIKTRRIQLLQVQQVAQFIRLQLIAQQIGIEQVKRLFNSNQQMGQWQREYITMGEVKEIFRSKPFYLQEDDIMIISRYIIEDVQEEYVYCDDLNENHREVVKAIIKNLIPQYPLYEDGSPEYYQMNEQIQRYGKNLKSALKSIAKEGIISKAKLQQAMKSIGMDLKQNIFQLIISKMCLKSKNLNELKYSTVF